MTIIFCCRLSNVITLSKSIRYEGSLLNAYRVLRTINPSPYMFYFSSDDIEVAGASPETLVKLEDGVLHTFPLAGTRPRGKDSKEDEELSPHLSLRIIPFTVEPICITCEYFNISI